MDCCGFMQICKIHEITNRMRVIGKNIWNVHSMITLHENVNFRKIIK